MAREDAIMEQFVTVARTGDIPEGQGRPFAVGDREVAVFLVQGRYYALDDYCPHMGSSLGASEVFGQTVVCSRHFWAFRLSDGVCVDVPRLKAETFEVRLQGDEIQIRLPTVSEGGKP